MAGGLVGARGVDGMMAAQEDAQRELKCSQAMMSVQAFERTCGINAQVRDIEVLLARCRHSLALRWPPTLLSHATSLRQAQELHQQLHCVSADVCNQSQACVKHPTLLLPCCLCFASSPSADLQAIPQAALLQRGELVQALLRSAPCLGLAIEVAHDAVQLLDRSLASPLAGHLDGRLLAAACLHITAQHAASAAPMLAALFQVGSPQQLLIAATQVRQVLGGGCVAISAMRVLRLLLERLGVESDEPTTTRYVCGQALALAGAVAQRPAFVGCPPSVVAVAVLYACRVAGGLLPAWPVALAALTGYGETSDVLQPYIKTAMQLLLEM
jgi:hypothetical protein